MAFTTGGDDGQTNSTTPVTVVAAPGAATERIVKTVTVKNRDTAAITVTLRKVSGGGTRELCDVTLQIDELLVWDDPIVLDDTSSSITLVLAGAVATTQGDWTSTWGDRS